MRQRRSRSLAHAAVLLACASLLVTVGPAAAQNYSCGCNCRGEGPLTTPPRIDVQIERIDTTRYPDVDVFFRVLDTGATTDFHKIILPDVKLEDGVTGGSLAAVPIIGNNFARPDLRPLATAVVLDRSSSVEDVLSFISGAINDFIGLMQPADRNTYRPTNPDVGLPDTTHAVGLSGNRDLGTTRFRPYTSSIPTLQAWVTANLNNTAGGSPIFGALDYAVTQTDLQRYDLPDGSRLVFLISDGMNNRPYPRPGPGSRTPNFAIQNAQASRIRVYTLAMSKVNDRGKVVGDVCRNWMKLVAQETGGVYFEPRSPFPQIPAAPVPPDDVPMTDTTTLSAAEKLEYLQIGLGTSANLARSQNKDQTFPNAEVNSDLKSILSKVMPDPAPITWKPFVDAWTANPLPTPINLDQVSYADLLALQNAMDGLGDTEVTDLELKKKDYYHDQVKNILTKIQASEKNVYRASYRLADAPFNGAERALRVTIQYPSAVNSVVTLLDPAAAVATYRAPSVLMEDRTAVVRFPLAASAPGVKAIFDAKDPRGGDWTRPPQIQLTTRLVTEVPSTDGSPPTRLAAALFDATGRYTQLTPSPALPNIAQVLAHINAEKADYEPLLRSINPIATFAPGEVVLQLTPRTPTGVRNPAGASLRPVPNSSERDRPRLVWYEVNAEVVRPYSYDGFRAGGGVERVDTSARYSLPTMTFYVADNTPPTLGVYLTPVGASTAMVAVRPKDTDDPSYATKVLLQGTAVGVPGDADTLTNGFNDPPYKLDGGGSTPGFAVPQNIAVRIQVIGKDNFDRNRDHRYLLPEVTNKLPECDAYNLETPFTPQAKDTLPPYLPKLTFDAVGTPVGMPAGTNFASGISYRFEEAGQSTDALADTKIFRAANVSVEGDTFTVNSGQDIILAVSAADATGNRTVVRVPILVTPVGLNIGKLTYESRRAR